MISAATTGWLEVVEFDFGAVVTTTGVVEYHMPRGFSRLASYPAAAAV